MAASDTAAFSTAASVTAASSMAVSRILKGCIQQTERGEMNSLILHQRIRHKYSNQLYRTNELEIFNNQWPPNQLLLLFNEKVPPHHCTKFKIATSPKV
mmetsp:Transcript_15928/g.34487  ORF Transcript_15928/g.34487 Transcript_15928/m.34487 type:complete len:99 (-) Transcript_15928:79-375(-)